MADLLHEDFALVAKDNPDRCLDKLVVHKAALFRYLQERWRDLFGITYDVLLYDLTSTYFESDPPFPEGDKREWHLDKAQQTRVLAADPGLEGAPGSLRLAPGFSHSSSQSGPV